MNEVVKLQEQFASFHSSSVDMNAKLDSIDAKATEIKLSTAEIKSTTDAVLNEVKTKSTKSDVNDLMLFGSSSPLSTRPFRPALNHGKTPNTFASLFHDKVTPSHSAKRKRGENPQSNLKQK